MSIAEVNDIFHKKHPLELIENWETVLGGGGDEKQGLVCCNGCQEPILGGCGYGCIPCRCFLHKTCAELEPTINHHLHFQHPLMLTANNPNDTWYCNTCDHQLFHGGFRYRCSTCDFDACIKCGVDATALYKDAIVKFEHEGHPGHTLALQLRPGAFLCDACKTDDKDFFYRCNDCTFWIHKTCATLAPKINIPNHHHHTLVLTYSVADNFYKFRFKCEFCKGRILRSYWVYHCANCRYFAHIKCALDKIQLSNSSGDPSTSDAEEQDNDHDFLHFPMTETFMDPLKLLHFEKIALDDNDTTEINHWSHDCPLILNVEPQGDNMYDINCNDPIKVCYGCVRPLSLPYYSCKDGCSFTLHKYCAKLPHTLAHQLHPDHLLNLVDFEDPKFQDYKCNSCFCFGNTFVYKCEDCKFYLDVNCAFLPNTIKHERHKHPLVQVIDPKPLCKACNTWFKGTSYVCKSCDFQLDLFCAVKSPHSIAHRHCKGHPVPLVYPPVEDHPEDFYCDICEKEMHPKFWMYYCHECDSTFHLFCIGQADSSENFYAVSTITVRYHKHPLTYVRRKKTPRYVCLGCNRDINGHLVLECRTGTCPFRVCRDCHLEKR